MASLIFCLKNRPVTNPKELNKLVKNTSESKLKKLSWEEVASQKMMHSNDAK